MISKELQQKVENYADRCRKDVVEDTMEKSGMGCSATKRSMSCIPVSSLHPKKRDGKLPAISGVAETREGCLVVHYNIRYPVTHRGELVKEGLEKTFAPAGWQLTVTGDSAPMYLPADDPKAREAQFVQKAAVGPIPVLGGFRFNCEVSGPPPGWRGHIS